MLFFFHLCCLELRCEDQSSGSCHKHEGEGHILWLAEGRPGRSPGPWQPHKVPYQSWISYLQTLLCERKISFSHALISLDYIPIFFLSVTCLKKFLICRWKYLKVYLQRQLLSWKLHSVMETKEKKQVRGCLRETSWTWRTILGTPQKLTVLVYPVLSHRKLN